VEWFLFISCTLMSVAGVYFIVHPFVDQDVGKYPIYWQVGFPAAVACIVLQSFLPALLRVTRSVHWIIIETATAAICMILIGPLGILLQFETGVGWTTTISSGIGGSDNIDFGSSIGLLGGLAALELLAIVWQTRGFQLSPTSSASLFAYTEIVVAFVLQHLINGDHMVLSQGIGIGLIVSACLIYTMHEHLGYLHVKATCGGLARYVGLMGTAKVETRRAGDSNGAMRRSFSHT